MTQKKLTQLFNELPSAEQKTLLAFAEFLHSRCEKVLPSPATKQDIPRPAQESVIAAIKRLSKTYPMLEKSDMLSETSDLVSQHIMQGRAAVTVIDELEIVFQRHYEVYCKKQ